MCSWNRIQLFSLSSNPNFLLSHLVAAYPYFFLSPFLIDSDLCMFSPWPTSFYLLFLQTLTTMYCFPHALLLSISSYRDTDLCMLSWHARLSPCFSECKRHFSTQLLAYCIAQHTCSLWLQVQKVWFPVFPASLLLAAVCLPFGSPFLFSSVFSKMTLESVFKFLYQGC